MAIDEAKGGAGPLHLLPADAVDPLQRDGHKPRVAVRLVLCDLGQEVVDEVEEAGRRRDGEELGDDAIFGRVGHSAGFAVGAAGFIHAALREEAVQVAAGDREEVLVEIGRFAA